LLWSIRRDGRGDDQARDLIARGVDWKSVYRQASSMKLLPLLYTRLQRLDPSCIPESELAQFRSAQIGTARRNLRLTKRLLHALESLNAIGIKAVPFKGPILALQAYGDVTLRPHVDLDVLIRPGDLHAAYDLLVRSGYLPSIRLNRWSERWWRGTQMNISFARIPEILEIHWAFTHRYDALRLCTPELWNRLRPFKLNNREILTLAPEDTLLMLCIHSARHLWHTLVHVADVAGLIGSQPQLDWRAVKDRAQAVGALRLLNLGLLLAMEMTGTRLPAEVEHEVRSDLPAGRLARQVMMSFALETPEPPETACDAFLLRSRERIRDRFLMTFLHVFDLGFTPSSTDWSVIRLPEALYPLFFIIRPFHLSYRLIRSAVSRKPITMNDKR
jgi:hypothetical protein